MCLPSASPIPHSPSNSASEAAAAGLADSASPASAGKLEPSAIRRLKATVPLAAYCLVLWPIAPPGRSRTIGFAPTSRRRKIGGRSFPSDWQRPPAPRPAARGKPLPWRQSRREKPQRVQPGNKAQAAVIEPPVKLRARAHEEPLFSFLKDSVVPFL